MMKALHLTIAAGALCLAGAAQARMPVFLELDGVKGETSKERPKPQSAQEQKPGQAIAAPGTSQRGGVNVAVGDVTGDGRADTALLLPAVQKIRATDSAPAANNPPPPPPPPSRLNKSSRTVIRIDHHDQGANQAEGADNGAADDINLGGKGSAGLLLPAVQKSGSAPNTSDPVPATSSQGPYKTRRTPPSQPQGLLLPARQRIPSSVTTGGQQGGTHPARRGTLYPRKAGEGQF
jgi:hypothetical protein